jgi:hypothetical protein
MTTRKHELHTVDRENGVSFLAELERAWLDGDLRSLMRAVNFCRATKRPLSEWAADGVIKKLEEACSDAKSISHERWTALHTWRWRCVKYLRELPSDVFLEKTGYKKKSVTRAHMIVADIEEEQTERPVTADAIRSSYDMVEKAIKAGGGAKYLAMTYPLLPREFSLAFPRECVEK